ncbi:MAG: plasmid replication initiator TrfA [Desulfobacteraceae bacterium]
MQKTEHIESPLTDLNDIKEHIKPYLKDDKYQRWIAPIEIRGNSDSSITLLLPNRFFLNKIKKEGLLAKFVEIACDIAKRKIEVSCEVCDSGLISKSTIHEIDSRAVQLPLWPDEVRAMPNHIARSNLFAAIKQGRRKMHNETVIESRGDACLCVTGHQLDQADADVWKQLLHLSRQKIAGERIYFTRYEILKSLDRRIGNSSYQWLDKAIDRIKTTNLSIETSKYKVSFNLIDSFVRNKETGEYWMTINPDVVKLFDRQEFSLIDWDRRKQISRGNQLAKWLQTYVASHQAGKPHSIEIKKIKKWSGNEGQFKVFKARNLPAALKELERLNIIQDWKIKADGQVVWFRPKS